MYTRLLAPAFSRLTASLALPLARAFAWVAFSSCRCKSPYPSFLFLSCALAMLIAAKPAHAQGSVSVTITTSPSTVTVPVNTPATFTATATGTPRPAAGWSVVGSPSYMWDTYPLVANPQYAATTTISETFPSAGTFTPTPFCHVAYTVQDVHGATASILGGASASASDANAATIKVIGGPISGDNNIYWFCDSSTSTKWGHLAAASGQPTGTTYSWSMAGNARLTGSSTSANVTYAGSGAGSSKPGDVTATVTYSLNGVSAKSPPFPITVHVPATFTIVPNGKTPPVKVLPPDPNAYGSTGQSITFQVLDSLGLPFPQNTAYWDESWSQPNGGGQPDHYGGEFLNAQSQSTDYFGVQGAAQPSNPNGDKVFGPLTHIYSITDAAATGGNVGCPIQTYTNVYYYTYGITGNGF